MCKDPHAVGPASKLTFGKGAKINVGDIIKIGWIKFKIREVRLNAEERTLEWDANTYELDEDQEPVDPDQIGVQIMFSDPKPNLLPNAKELQLDQDEEIPPCRICLINEMSDKENPLINPCLCKGTQGLIHV